MRSRNVWLLALLALAIPAVALGKPAKSEVDITKVRAIDQDTARYEGKVSSKKGRCEKGRKVVVIHDSDPPFTIGEDETDENGNWKIYGAYPQNPADDRIVVKLLKKPGCKGDKTDFEFYD